MDKNAFLETIRGESEALAAAASTVEPGTPVPSCPDWTMARLVTHIAQVQHWAAKTVETRATERAPFGDVPPPPEHTQLVPWFREATQRLLATLTSTDPATPVWSWTSDRTAAFWVRRQAQEVAVHRWDAQNTAGVPQPLETALAVDGIDELLGMHRARGGERFVGQGERIRLSCTDHDVEWMARLGPQGLEVSHEPAKGDAAARGTASDLDLFLWGRIPLATLAVSGDAALLTRFQLLTAL